MERFDERGMLVFPNPDYKDQKPQQNRVIITHAFGPGGNSVLTKKATFSGYPGIMIHVKGKGGKEGDMVLSPILRDKSKIALDVELESGEVLEVFESKDGKPLTVFDTCECGAKLVSVFLTPDLNPGNSAVFCTRVDCFNSEIQTGGEIVSRRLMESEDGFNH